MIYNKTIQQLYSEFKYFIPALVLYILRVRMRRKELVSTRTHTHMHTQIII